VCVCVCVRVCVCQSALIALLCGTRIELNLPISPSGGKILLNNARLVLKRGRRYGLCGANGAGKSTLMKAIAAGKVDGFPPPDKLLTVYVEHDIQASLEELTVSAMPDRGCVMTRWYYLHHVAD